MKDEMEGLTPAQVLQGIEDVVKEKLGWQSAIVVYPGRGINGMIIGMKHFVDMMTTAAQGKSNVSNDELN